MQTITYKVDIDNGGGQLTVKALNASPIQFTQTGQKDQELDEGVQQIVVIGTPDPGASIEFEILKGKVSLIDPYNFSKHEEKVFVIKV